MVTCDFILYHSMFTLECQVFSGTRGRGVPVPGRLLRGAPSILELALAS